MKKGLLVFVTVLLTAAMLIACGRPHNLTQESYDLGCRALELLEKYNKAEISAEDAESRLASIVASLENLDIEDDIATISNDTLAIMIDNAVFSLHHNTGGTLDEETRLKEYLGK